MNQHFAMPRIDSIHLDNFKSFHGKCTINFSPRFTTIIGPNEGGKLHLEQAFQFICVPISERAEPHIITEDESVASVRMIVRIGGDDEQLVEFIRQTNIACHEDIFGINNESVSYADYMKRIRSVHINDSLVLRSRTLLTVVGHEPRPRNYNKLFQFVCDLDQFGGGDAAHWINHSNILTMDYQVNLKHFHKLAKKKRTTIARRKDIDEQIRTQSEQIFMKLYGNIFLRKQSSLELQKLQTLKTELDDADLAVDFNTIDYDLEQLKMLQNKIGETAERTEQFLHPFTDNNSHLACPLTTQISAEVSNLMQGSSTTTVLDELVDKQNKIVQQKLAYISNVHEKRILDLEQNDDLPEPIDDNDNWFAEQHANFMRELEKSEKRMDKRRNSRHNNIVDEKQSTTSTAANAFKRFDEIWHGGDSVPIVQQTLKSFGNYLIAPDFESVIEGHDREKCQKYFLTNNGIGGGAAAENTDLQQLNDVHKLSDLVECDDDGFNVGPLKDHYYCDTDKDAIRYSELYSVNVVARSGICYEANGTISFRTNASAVNCDDNDDDDEEEEEKMEAIGRKSNDKEAPVAKINNLVTDDIVVAFDKDLAAVAKEIANWKAEHERKFSGYCRKMGVTSVDHLTLLVAAGKADAVGNVYQMPDTSAENVQELNDNISKCAELRTECERSLNHLQRQKAILTKLRAYGITTNDLCQDRNMFLSNYNKHKDRINKDVKNLKQEFLKFLIYLRDEKEFVPLLRGSMDDLIENDPNSIDGIRIRFADEVDIDRYDEVTYDSITAQQRTMHLQNICNDIDVELAQLNDDVDVAHKLIKKTNAQLCAWTRRLNERNNRLETFINEYVAIELPKHVCSLFGGGNSDTSSVMPEIVCTLSDTELLEPIIDFRRSTKHEWLSVRPILEDQLMSAVAMLFCLLDYCDKFGQKSIRRYGPIFMHLIDEKLAAKDVQLLLAYLKSQSIHRQVVFVADENCLAKIGHIDGDNGSIIEIVIDANARSRVVYKS